MGRVGRSFKPSFSLFASASRERRTTSGRVRAPGAGRKRSRERDPGLLPALLALIEPEERGDPMSPLRWTTKSTRTLAAELTRQGHPVSADTVADLLHDQGFSLQANAKMLEGKQSPDRDTQFRYLNEQVQTHTAAGQPVVSVDTKKKELLGQFANGGREWRPAGNPVRVADHDFAARATGDKVAPYGIYDLTANTGWVNVGTDHDTAVFAVESLRRWWRGAGAVTYPDATKLLITADAGGSNSPRSRVFKAELAALAADTGLDITVCHFPPGTSKWNKIEHRLFSHITHNWRGRPLTSHEVVVNTIAATTTRTGLRVHAELDTGLYPLGVTIDDEQLAALPLTTHDWHGDWNYTLLCFSIKRQQQQRAFHVSATAAGVPSVPRHTSSGPILARTSLVRRTTNNASRPRPCGPGPGGIDCPVLTVKSEPAGRRSD